MAIRIKNMLKSILSYFNLHRDALWLGIWIGGITLIWLWNFSYLNQPALLQLETGFFNTILISLLVTLFASFFSWIFSLFLHFSKNSIQLILQFVLNLIRSIPQIIAILIGYVFITFFIQYEILINELVIMLAVALIISLVIFPEIVVLLMERIDYFKRLDFYNAMLVCGISELHIVNREILIRNSLIHLLNKLISVFGMTVFLQCSIDFIISVGLSTEISSVNFPLTLGSLLAKIDSKQDILAIGYALTHWTHIDNLFFEHLQGISVAFLIVFTLVSIHHMANAYAQRHHL